MALHASRTVSLMGFCVVESIASENGSFVEVGLSLLRHRIAVFTVAMHREKVEWASPKPPSWRRV